ncbi:MAG: hypothetical protein A3H64_04020 [Candidatus Ryanbacteria bacterium RIFCSPLOWO2_02_FULL_45_11c]|uniref:Uncharacterized protein n=1 Tax=Candidatus Ryanbacteria bacterium RIFCSPLOWO2_02_FULL_45_11c TaxID=1802128 RepID=A0A1G2GZS3_9BACT|nr:MAG: hypothetical protein A3H64_04020 [Candidatus Ryanbacteria bacterium RIFCSPLOWO2_02_FULL_45_11c]
MSPFYKKWLKANLFIFILGLVLLLSISILSIREYGGNDGGWLAVTFLFLGGTFGVILAVSFGTMILLIVIDKIRAKFFTKTNNK